MGPRKAGVSTLSFRGTSLSGHFLNSRNEKSDPASVAGAFILRVSSS